MKHAIASGFIAASFIAASLVAASFAVGIANPMTNTFAASAVASTPSIATLEQSIYRIKALPGYTTYGNMEPYARAKATPYFREYQYLNELISVLESMINDYSRQNATDLIDIVRAADDAVIACGFILNQGGGAAASNSAAPAESSSATSSTKTSDKSSAAVNAANSSNSTENSPATTSAPAAAPLRASSASASLADAETASAASSSLADSDSKVSEATVALPTSPDFAGRSRSEKPFSFVTLALEALKSLKPSPASKVAQSSDENPLVLTVAQTSTAFATAGALVVAGKRKQ